jgi:hypothetical protein
MIHTPAAPFQSMLLPLILPDQPEARIRAGTAVAADQAATWARLVKPSFVRMLLDVGFGGALGDDQGGGDVFVARSWRDEGGDLLFAAGQRGRRALVRRRRGPSGRGRGFHPRKEDR